jgi:hypothetical protein
MTQHEKILAIMLSDVEKWWHAEDLMQHGDIFVGYKAQARISELALQYPEMIEREHSTKGNRQHMYRIRWDNWKEFMPKVTQELRDCIADNKPVNLQFV